MSEVERTNQQHAAIAASKDPEAHPQINIVAVAGSGKTSTTEAMAREREVSTVYVVADSSSRREARAKFPPHVAVHTAHSLAFQVLVANNPQARAKFQAANNGQRLGMKEIQRWVDLEPIQRAGGVNRYAAAASVTALLNAFQNSADMTIEPHHLDDERLPKTVSKLADEARITAFRNAVCDGTRALWAAMVNEPDCPILHGTYLKWLQLDKPVFNFERWLCDEFQDANPVMADIISQQQAHGAQVIRVGDPSQQIYSWRGAINALDGVSTESASRFVLTQSFRFGPKVAALANQVLGYAGRDERVDGVGTDQPRIDYNKPVTVIARNNITLFHHAVKAIQDGKSVAIQGGINQTAALIESAYQLHQGKPNKVRAPLLREYEDWDQLKQVARIAQDATLNQLVSIIEIAPEKAMNHVENLKSAVENSASPGGEQVDRLMTTVHQAKGSEWPQVWLANDLAIPDRVINDLYEGKELSVADEERFNTLYVALTRTQGAVEMAPKLQANFTRIVSVSDSVEPHGYPPVSASNKQIAVEGESLFAMGEDERMERISLLRKIYPETDVEKMCSYNDEIKKVFDEVVASEIERMSNELDLTSPAMG